MRRHTDAERQSRESLFCAQALGTEGSSSRGSARVRRGQWPEGEKLEPLVGFLQEGLGEAGQAGVGTAVPSNFGRSGAVLIVRHPTRVMQAGGQPRECAGWEKELAAGSGPAGLH